jgi:hypothetical protein
MIQQEGIKMTKINFLEISKQAFKEVFVEGTPESQEKLDDALGVAISQYTQWDGIQICKIFMCALEDANFHTFANIVEDYIKVLEEEIK